jgi:adenosylcobyric acid synthase
MTAQKLMLMGPGPNSGKTIISVGLCRALANAGVRVAPFKAVSVIKRRDLDDDGQPIYVYGLIHHLRAARISYDTAMNPVTIFPTSPTSGDFYIHGRHCGSATFMSEDMLVLRYLPHELQQRAYQAVVDGFQAVVAQYEFVVVEGASGPGDVLPVEDIPNIVTARLTRAPVLLSCQFSRGGAAAAILGTMQCLPADVRALVKGFAFSDVRDPALMVHASELIQARACLPQVGSIPHLTLWDGPPETYPTNEAAYEAWGDAVSHGLDLERLGIRSLLGSEDPTDIRTPMS